MFTDIHVNSSLPVNLRVTISQDLAYLVSVELFDLIFIFVSCGLISNEVKCLIFRNTGQCVFVHAHVFTEFIMLLSMIVHQLHSLTIKLELFMFQSVP
jgi:hypothetical protein